MKGSGLEVYVAAASVSARHKASSAALRHAAATSNTLHALHIVIALVKMTAVIRTLQDKMHMVEKRRVVMSRKKILRRIL